MEWTGEERRGIPIHILNHIDEKLDSHVNKVESMVQEHTEEEMDRYKEILAKIESHRQENELRHSSLSSSFMSYAERVDTFCQNIAEAFPHNEQGKPDFHGHGRAHISWIENSNR